MSKRLASLVSVLKVNEPLKNHTTFHLGGPADYFAEVQNRKELLDIYNFAKKQNVSLMVLGGGSNVLVDDRGFRGIIMKLSGEFREIALDGDVLSAGCGALTQTVLKASIDKELSGLECLSGIPGTIGGAIAGNAGSKDSWIGDAVISVEVLNEEGKILEIPKEKIKFGYRSSGLNNNILLKAKLNLKKSLKNDIFTKVERYASSREQTQPLGSWNAGCIFKNPDGGIAGRLIDECGLKGLSFGGAKVSEKHANFILNVDNAKSSDVFELMKIIRSKVKEKFNINLELEIKIIK